MGSSGNANTESYSEVISLLQNYLNEAEEYCQSMEKAAQDCVDNMDEDPNAGKASAKLGECTSQIRQRFEAIQEVIQALSEELEDVNEVGNFSFD